jgi:hypothetical protein
MPVFTADGNWFVTTAGDKNTGRFFLKFFQVIIPGVISLQININAA